MGCHALLQGTEPRSPTLRVDSLLSEPPGKPRAGVEDKTRPSYAQHAVGERETSLLIFLLFLSLVMGERETSLLIFLLFLSLVTCSRDARAL